MPDATIYDVAERAGVSISTVSRVLNSPDHVNVATPKDLAVIGFDDVEIADYTGLATVRQPLEESGRVAADLLLARLADGSRPVQHVRLPLTILKRETA